MAKTLMTAAPETGLAKGFTCSCGKHETYPPYVFAHWDIELTYSCECKKKYTLLRGHCEEK